MIVLMTAFLLINGTGEEPRPRSSLVRDLASHAVKLSQAKGLPSRIEELGFVVSRLADGLTASMQAGRMEDSIFLARLALTLVEEGLLPRLREVADDDSTHDDKYQRAVDATGRACEGARTLASSLPEDQRARVYPKLDAASPRVKKMSDWIKERIERHGRKTGPPSDGSDRSPGGSNEVNPH